LDAFNWPAAANFFEFGCVFGWGVWFIEDMVFFVGEACAAEAVVEGFAVVAIA